MALCALFVAFLALLTNNTHTQAPQATDLPLPQPPEKAVAIPPTTTSPLASPSSSPLTSTSAPTPTPAPAMVVLTPAPTMEEKGHHTPTPAPAPTPTASSTPTPALAPAATPFGPSIAPAPVFPLLRGLRLAQGKQAKLEVANKLVEILILAEDAFVKLSEGKDFFGGDEIGYLNIALGCFLGWFKVNEKLYDVKLLDETKIPNLVSWDESFLSHVAVKNAIPETKELLEFTYMFLPGTKAQS